MLILVWWSYSCGSSGPVLSESVVCVGVLLHVALDVPPTAFLSVFVFLEPFIFLTFFLQWSRFVTVDCMCCIAGTLLDQILSCLYQALLTSTILYFFRWPWAWHRFRRSAGNKTFPLICMKFEVMLKQFKLNILIQHCGEIYWNQGK